MTISAGSQAIGKVFILYGTVKAVAPDGTVRVLGPNSLVYANERIITESDGSVSIMLDGPPPAQIDLGRMSDVLLSEDVYAGATPEVVQDAAAEAEQIQEAIEGEGDIELEATAAGGSAGTGSHEVVYFELDANAVSPESGAETVGFTPGMVSTLDGVLEGEVAAMVMPMPTANPDEASTQEGLEGTQAFTEGNVLENDLSGDSTIIVTAVYGSAGNVGLPITTPLGGVIIINADGSYNYTPPAQADHSEGPVQDVISYTITNSEGNSSTSTLSVNVFDTAPLAVDDSGEVGEDGSISVISGDVLANDIPSADIPSTFVAWGNSGADQAAIAELAKYGTLTLNTDGTYTFELNNTLAAVQALTSEDTISQTITYTMTDSDGNQSSATLTIAITGAEDSANVTVTSEGADSTVYEQGLTSVSDTSEADEGSFAVSATDGIAKITVGGMEFTIAELQELSTFPSAGIPTGEGTLVLTGYSGDSFGGTVYYTYTLNEAQFHTQPDNDATLTDSVALKVDGIGGSTDTANLTINIVDDVPQAVEDSGTTTEGGELAVAQIDGVLANDTIGADLPGTVVSVTAGQLTVDAGTAIAGLYGTLTIAPDGSYTYVANASVDAGSEDVFIYTMQDKDGDPSQETLTITFEGDNNAPMAEDSAAAQSDAAWYADTQTASIGSLAFAMGEDVPVTVSMTYDGGLGAADKTSVDGETIFTASNWVLTINESTGVYSFEQTGAYTHELGADSDLGTVTVTLTDSDGSEKVVTLELTISDMGPTIGEVQSAVLANQDGSVTGDIELSFGADGPHSTAPLKVVGDDADGKLNLDYTSDDTVEAYVKNADGSNGDWFYTMKVNTDGTYTFDYTERPVKVTPVDFGKIGGSGGVETITVSDVSGYELLLNGLLYDGTNLVDYPTTDVDDIKPQGSGFGIGNSATDQTTINDNEGFSITISDGDSDADIGISFDVAQQGSGSSFDINWIAYEYKGGNTIGNGAQHFDITESNVGQPFEISPADLDGHAGYIEVWFTDVTGSNVRIQDFALTESIIPDDQPLHFSVVAMDGDGDLSNTAEFDVLLTGDGGPDYTLVGDDSNEILVGGSGDDTLTGDGGEDTFKVGEGDDTIKDYTLDEGDKVDISHVLDTDAGDYVTVSDDGYGNAMLTIYDSSDAAKGSVTFEGIDYDSGGMSYEDLKLLVDIDDGTNP